MINRPLKICMLTDDPQTFGGGPEHIRRISAILRQKYKLTVDVVTPKNMDPQFTLSNLRHRLKYVLWALRFLLTSNYDLYHSHTYSTDLVLPIVKLRGRKTSVTIHGLGANLIGGGVLNRIGIPEFFSGLILNVWPFDLRFSASRLKGFVFVGNGVDISEFDKEKAKPNSKYFTVLCVSRRDPVKGINFLEEAIKIVQKKHSQVRLNLVSGRKRTAKDFKTANLYVLPSLSEGFPIVLLEAMAAKLPIVTTDVGDCKELIMSAKTGIVVYPGNVDDLSRAIIEMIKKKNRRELGENGCIFVKDNYTWEKVAGRVYEEYKKVLS